MHQSCRVVELGEFLAEKRPPRRRRSSATSASVTRSSSRPALGGRSLQPPFTLLPLVERILEGHRGEASSGSERELGDAGKMFYDGARIGASVLGQPADDVGLLAVPHHAELARLLFAGTSLLERFVLGAEPRVFALHAGHRGAVAARLAHVESMWSPALRYR